MVPNQVRYQTALYLDNNNFIKLMAERVGFEPTVPLSITGFQDQLLKPLGQLSLNGDPSATRTRDTLIKSQVLYRLS